MFNPFSSTALIEPLQDVRTMIKESESNQERAALAREAQLNTKIEEASRKKDLLIARQRRAEAQQKIQETMRGFGDTSAFESFDRMAEKVDRMEAQAEANAELARDMAGSDLDAKFASLEQQSGSSDALQALKSRMGVAQAPAAAPAPVAEKAEESVEEFDFEQLERELAATRATLARS